MRGKNNSRSGQGRRGRTRRIVAKAGVNHRRARDTTYKVTITHPGIDTALYQRGAGQLLPEPVFIYIDLSERRIWAMVGREWEIREWENPAVFRYELGSQDAPTADAAYEFMRGPLDRGLREPSLPLLVSRMAAGYSRQRTPNDHWEAQLNRGARRAESELRNRIEQATFYGEEAVGTWAPYTGDYEYVEEYGITATTTDDQLYDIEDEIRKDLGPENYPEWNILVWNGLLGHLIELRDGLTSDGGAA